MSIVGQLTRPCTIRRRSDSATVNDYGDPIPGAPVETETFCELQQMRERGGAEGDLMGEVSDTKWLLVLAAGEVIGTADSVVVDGQAFEMVGAPWPVWDPLTQSVDHIEATLRRTA